MKKYHSIKVPFVLKTYKKNKAILQKEILDETMIKSKWKENQGKL